MDDTGELSDRALEVVSCTFRLNLSMFKVWHKVLCHHKNNSVPAHLLRDLMWTYNEFQYKISLTDIQRRTHLFLYSFITARVWVS